MIRKLTNAHSREPVCGVFAATLATPDMPFMIVKNMANEAMGQKKRWRGSMHLPALKKLLTDLRVTFMDVINVCGQPLKSVVQDLDPQRHYIAFVTNHYVTIHDGKGYDQSNVDGTPLDKLWCIGRNVRAILEIDRSKPALTFAELSAEW